MTKEIGMRAVHPYSLEGVLQNQFSNLVPLRRTNQQVYQLGRKHQPGLETYAPSWEVINVVLGPRQTRSVRVNLQRDFHLIGLVGSSTSAAGFRLQLFDMKKKRRFQDRGFGSFNLLGGQGSALFLRRPYRFEEPNSTVLCEIQNYDTAAQSTNEVVLYGSVLWFADPRPWRLGRPGRCFLKRFLDVNLGWPWFGRGN